MVKEIPVFLDYIRDGDVIEGCIFYEKVPPGKTQGQYVKIMYKETSYGNVIIDIFGDKYFLATKKPTIKRNLTLGF